MKATNNTRLLLLVAGFSLLGLALVLLLFGDVLFGGRPTSSGNGESSLPQVPQFTQPEVGIAELATSSGDLIQVGDTAYDFTLNDLDGNLISLSDYRGRPVILNFWATWCVPCRVEMPELQQALNDYEDEGLAILALNQQESREAVEAFFEEFDLSLTSLLDSEGTVSRLYSIVVFPGTVFINADGQVTAIHRGVLVREQIDDYLGEMIGVEG